MENLPAREGGRMTPARILAAPGARRILPAGGHAQAAGQGCSMITKGAHHISLSVRDVDRSMAFYGDLLGLPLIDRPEMGLPGKWLQAGAVELHLIGVSRDMNVDVGSTPASTTPLANHLAFEIEDYDAVRSKLVAAGLEPIELGVIAGQMFVSDPDGHVIEFIKPNA
jgi:glyoxylase I family protein